MQRSGHLKCHRRAPPREAKDDHVGTVSVSIKKAGEDATRLSPVFERTIVHRSRIYERL